MCTKYTFREITEKEELEQFFKFRYQIYSECCYKGYLKENSFLMDIDVFDTHSKHYALYCENNIAGYFRVVLPREEYSNQEVLEIGNQKNLLGEYDSYLKNGHATYPFLSYKNVPQSRWNFVETLKKRNENIAEASRLILRPEFRTIKTAKFLIECAIVLYVIICLGQKHGVITCSAKHSPIYQRYGFKPIDNNSEYISNGVENICLTLSSVPVYLNDMFQAMCKEFKQTGRIEREL